jgi:hypothetical protein
VTNIDVDDDERDAFLFEIALSLEDLDPDNVRDRARRLRPCVMPRRRLPITMTIARALAQSALSDDQRCDRFLAWCDGFGIVIVDGVVDRIACAEAPPVRANALLM